MKRRSLSVKRENIYIVVGMIVLLIMLFYPVLFQGKSFGSPDSINPKASGLILNRAWEETGEFPLWQPWIFCGMPTAEAFTFISQLYFPSHILRYLFLTGILGQLFHLLLAGLGGVVLLRQLNVSRLPATLGGSAFMLMPYMITMLVFGHGSQMMTAAYLPWVMWAVVRLFQKPNFLHMGLLGLLMGLQLQRAHAQIAYYTWMLVGAYVLFQLILTLRPTTPRVNIYRGTAYFAGAALLAIGLALVIYLPSIGYTPYSVRGAGSTGGAAYDYATAWSFHPLEMATFLIPSAFGFGGQTYWGYMPFTDYPNYMGIIILALAIMGLVFRWNDLAAFFLTTSLLALAISFGKHLSIVYDIVYAIFPYFNKFRVPAMILILLQFNVAVLAAFGLDAVLKLKYDTVPRWLLILAGGIGLGILILVFGQGSLRTALFDHFTPPRTQNPRVVQAINSLRWQNWYRDAWVTCIFLGALVGGLWLWFQRKLSKTVFLSGIIILALLDIGIVDQKIIQPKPRSGRASQLYSKSAIQRQFQTDEIIRFLTGAKPKPFRIYPLGAFFGEPRFKAFGIESVGGYHPAKLQIYNQFLAKTGNAGTLPLMRMLNVRYIVSPQEISHPDLILQKQGSFVMTRGTVEVYLYELKNYLPRAWFVSRVQVLDNSELVWNMLKSPSFDPADVAYVTNSDEKGKRDYSVGKVDTIMTSIHRVTIQTTSNETGFLVVSEVDYPLRWKAFLDGREVSYEHVDGVLRGLEIPAGEHRVEFVYDKSAFHRGLYISLLSLGLCLGFIGFGLFFAQRSK
ncbi:MAG: hypothetical protein ACE5DP_03590 [Fidelibacterota bacterium]